MNKRNCSSSLFILLLAFVGCSGSPEPKTEPATTPSVPTVQVGHPQHKTLERVTEQPGYIEAFAETPLYAKLAGYVEKLNVDIGDHVTGPKTDSQGQVVAPGQVLVKLSIPEMGEELAQKKALAVQAGAQLEQAQSQIKVAEAVVATGLAGVDQAAAQEEKAAAELDRWKSEYGRVAELGRSSAVPQKLVDETKSQFRAAEGARREAAAKLQAAKTGLLESQALVEKARADEAVAKAAREVAEADFRRAQALDEYTLIRAPYDGVVSARNVVVGHFVQPTATAKEVPLMVVVHADPVRIFIDVPEVDAGYADVEDRVAIRIPALDGHVVEGRITRTSWALNTTTRTLRAEVDIPNADGKLRPGMYSIARIVLASKPGALSLPRSAILTRDGQPYCFVVRDQKVVETAVTVGLEGGGDVEIVSGLSPDDQVVTSGAANLKDGQVVSIAQAPAKS